MNTATREHQINTHVCGECGGELRGIGRDWSIWDREWVCETCDEVVNADGSPFVEDDEATECCSCGEECDDLNDDDECVTCARECGHCGGSGGGWDENRCPWCRGTGERR